MTTKINLKFRCVFAQFEVEEGKMAEHPHSYYQVFQKYQEMIEALLERALSTPFKNC